MTGRHAPPKFCHVAPWWHRAPSQRACSRPRRRAHSSRTGHDGALLRTQSQRQAGMAGEGQGCAAAPSGPAWREHGDGEDLWSEASARVPDLWSAPSPPREPPRAARRQRCGKSFRAPASPNRRQHEESRSGATPRAQPAAPNRAPAAAHRVEQVSTRILGRHTATIPRLSLFLTVFRMVLPKILVLTAHGATWEQMAPGSARPGPRRSSHPAAPQRRRGWLGSLRRRAPPGRGAARARARRHLIHVRA